MNIKKKIENWWTGKYRLALTFWVGFISMIAISMIFVAMGIVKPIHPWATFPFLIFFSVSIWRSASNYKGYIGWSRGAKLLVILWIINHGLNIVVG